MRAPRKLFRLAAVLLAAAGIAEACVDNDPAPPASGAVDASLALDGSAATSDSAAAPDAASLEDSRAPDGAATDAGAESGSLDAAADSPLDGAGPDAGTSGPYVYFANNSGSTIVGYLLDPTTGGLTRLDMDPATGGVQDLATSGQPMAVAAHPNGKFLWSAHAPGTGTIGTYAIAKATGALTRVDVDPGTAGTQDFSAGAGLAFRYIAADPKGRVLYATDTNGEKLVTLSVNAATGALAVVSSVAAAPQPRGLAVDPAGAFLYVLTEKFPPTFARVPLDAVTGIPSPGSLADGGYPNVTLGASGNCISGSLDTRGNLYTACSQDQSLHAIGFDPDAGTLKSLGSAAAGVAPIGVAVHPNGSFAYAASFSSQNLRTYALAADAGPTVIGSALALGGSCRTLLVDEASGTLLAGCDSKTISFRVDGGTGALTKVNEYPGASDSSYSFAIVRP